MPTELSTSAIDKSTFVITAAFTDEDGAEVTPNAITWTLTNDAGGVINGKEDEVIAPDTSVRIVLSGDDLKYSDGPFRVLTIEATYDSTLGNNLPLKDQVRFGVQDLVAVA